MFQIELVSVSEFVGLLVRFCLLHKNFKVIIYIIFTIQIILILLVDLNIIGVKFQWSSVYGEAFCHQDVDPVLFIFFKCIMVQIVNELGPLLEKEVFANRYKLRLDGNVGTQLLDQISLSHNLPNFLS